MESTEHAALVRIAGVMGMGAAQLEQLLRMRSLCTVFQVMQEKMELHIIGTKS